MFGHYEINLKLIFLHLVLVVTLGCSSSSSTSTETTTTSSIANKAGAAVSGMFGGSSESSLSEEFAAALHKAIEKYLVQKALAQEGDCGNETEGESDIEGLYIDLNGDGDGVTVTDLTGTHGPSAAQVTVSNSNFCDAGGDFAGFVISAGTAIAFTCIDSDSTPTTVYMGSAADDISKGVFLLSDVQGGNQVYGHFVISESETDFTNADSVDCEGTPSGDMNCYDSEGEAISGDSGTTCQAADSSSEETASYTDGELACEDQVNEDGIVPCPGMETCSSSDDCKSNAELADLSSGLSLENCGAGVSVCLYSCDTDADCGALRDALVDEGSLTDQAVACYSTSDGAKFCSIEGVEP